MFEKVNLDKVFYSLKAVHKVVLYSPHRFEELPAFVTHVNFGSCEATVPPNSLNGDWIMERNIFVRESMRNYPFTKFKLTLLSSASCLKNFCFNSPHTYS